MSSIGGQELLYGAVSTVVPRAPLALWDSSLVFEVSNCASHSILATVWFCLRRCQAFRQALWIQNRFFPREGFLTWFRGGDAQSKNEIWATKGRKTLTVSWLTVTLTTACLLHFWHNSRESFIYSQVSSFQLLVCLIRSINLPDMRYVFYKKENILSFSKGNMEIT